jgi:hypothetical protein
VAASQEGDQRFVDYRILSDDSLGDRLANASHYLLYLDR